MLNHVNAPPGNGKSAFLMEMIEETFQISDNNIIVWSLPLKELQLLKVLAAKYPDRAEEIPLRFTVLDFEAGFTWWRFRGADREGNQVVWEPLKEWVKAADGVMHEKISWPGVKRGEKRVTYFLDEWAEAYNITTSGTFTNEHRNALRQHRKMSCDVWIANPYFEELAKPYREIGQYWYEVKNLGYTEKGYGRAKVRLGTHFMWSRYPSPPTSERSKPNLSGNFFLKDSKENGIHSCYNTAGGVGISGQLADMGTKRSGMNWKVAVVAFAAVIMLLLFGGWKMYQRGKKGFNFASLAPKVTLRSDAKKTDSAGGGGGQEVLANNQPSTLPPAPPLPQPVAQPIVRKFPNIEWYAQAGDDITFGLDNGEILKNPDGWFTGKELMLKNGAVYFYRPNFRKPSLVSQPSLKGKT